VLEETHFVTSRDIPVDKRIVNSDASEAAILKFVEKLQSVSDFRVQRTQVMTVPFSSTTNKSIITCNKVDHDSNQFRLCMKSAPEGALDCCSSKLTRDGN
jgi:magnesium-transporting ATPase (P-type)